MLWANIFKSRFRINLHIENVFYQGLLWDFEKISHVFTSLPPSKCKSFWKKPQASERTYLMMCALFNKEKKSHTGKIILLRNKYIQSCIIVISKTKIGGVSFTDHVGIIWHILTSLPLCRNFYFLRSCY